jgi:transposase
MEEDPPLLPAEKKKEKGENGGRRKGAGRPVGPSNLSNMQIEQRDTIGKEREESKAKENALLHEHLLLRGEKGKTTTEGEGRIILSLIIGLLLAGEKSDTAAIEKASFLLGKGNKTLWSLWNYWKEKKEILVPSTENRGGGSPLHPLHHIQLESDSIATIHRTIYELNENGDGCKTIDIIDALKEEHGISLIPRSLRSVLHKLGYEYGKAKFIGCVNKEERKKRMIVFVKQYAQSLSKQDTGTHVVAYQDESYINQFHSDDRTWFAPSSPSKNEVSRAPSKGKRMIIVHSITRDGLLYVDENGSPAIAGNNVSTEAKNAELVFEGHYADGDYHKNMNADVFSSWLRNRFIPAFNARYPGKKCILVLDNAAYHRARGAEYVNPATMTKLELIQHLELFGINSITVNRRGQSVQFNSASFYRRGGDSGPTNAELKAALQDYLNRNPHLQRSRAQTLFDAEGWQLLFTPPYNSECQPIEMVWAKVKKFVANQYTSDRTMEAARLQTLDGFYGYGEENYAGVTSEFCRSCIRHVKEYCDWFCRETIVGVEKIEDLPEENFPPPALVYEEGENDDQIEVNDNDEDIQN